MDVPALTMVPLRILDDGSENGSYYVVGSEQFDFQE